LGPGNKIYRGSGDEPGSGYQGHKNEVYKEWYNVKATGVPQIGHSPKAVAKAFVCIVPAATT